MSNRAGHQPRAYTEQSLSAGARIEITGDKHHHLRTVLRLKPGATVVLFDGRGGEYPARITDIGRQALRLECGEHQQCAQESPLGLTLGQAIARGERMDYAVAKAVELGVSRIQPLCTERGKVTLTGARAAKKLGHWQRIAIAAAEQSGREQVPAVAAPMPLSLWLAQPPLGRSLVLDPGAAQRLGQLPPPADGQISVLIGPESGLSADELAQTRAAAFTPVGLGPRVLRTETAGVACLAAIQCLWGDLA